MFINITAFVAADWPAPNYVSPENRGPAAPIVCSILTALVTVILAIRVYTRIAISNGFGLDDILICIAYVPAVGMTGLSIYAQYHLGWALHAWDIPPELTVPSLQATLAIDVLFSAATNLTKLSIVALLDRLATAGGTRLRWIIRAFGVIVFFEMVVFITVIMLQCTPLSDYWTISFTPQNCINMPVHLAVAGSINCLFDLVLVVLPIPLTIQLKLQKRQRYIVIGLFTGGVFAAAAGFSRVYILWAVITASNFDTSWDATLAVIAGALELYIGIICASIPATKPFFNRYVPRLLGSQVSTSGVRDPQSEKLGQNSDAENRMMGKPRRHYFDADISQATSSSGMTDDHSLPVQSPASMSQMDSFNPELPTALRPPPPQSPVNLDKPLPSLRIAVDRTISWSELSSGAASDGRGTIVVALGDRISTHSRRASAPAPSREGSLPPLPGGTWERLNEKQS